MKAKILVLLVFFALTSCAGSRGYNEQKQQRQNTVKKTNKRNQKALKKWGLAQVKWEEVQHAR